MLLKLKAIALVIFESPWSREHRLRLSKYNLSTDHKVSISWPRPNWSLEPTICLVVNSCNAFSLTRIAAQSNCGSTF